MAQREHIGVALDDHGTLLLGDRRARAVEPVQHVALAKELSLGRVHVFCAHRIVLAQLARLEPEHAAAGICEWKQQAAGEVVVAAAVDETGGGELLPREAALESLACERRAAERETEAVLAAHLLVQTAPGKVIARKRARLRVPEVPLVERRRCVEQLEEAFAPAAPRILLRRGLLVLDLHVEAVREPLDRAGEVQLLGLAHERDDIALRAAAEAVVELLDGVHRKARRALLVERTPPDVSRPGLAQLRAAADDRDDVGCRLHLFDRRVLDQCHRYPSSATYVSANRSVMPAMKSTICSGSSPPATRCSKMRRIAARARSCSSRACGPR